MFPTVQCGVRVNKDIVMMNNEYPKDNLKEHPHDKKKGHVVGSLLFFVYLCAEGLGLTGQEGASWNDR